MRRSRSAAVMGNAVFVDEALYDDADLIAHAFLVERLQLLGRERIDEAGMDARFDFEPSACAAGWFRGWDGCAMVYAGGRSRRVGGSLLSAGGLVDEGAEGAVEFAGGLAIGHEGASTVDGCQRGR